MTDSATAILDPVALPGRSGFTSGEESLSARLALLTVRGADARTFLDSQLTRNVPPAGVASLAGYCSPKGRLLATFVMWNDDDGVGLVVARDLATAVAKRLRMYVLRAQAVIDQRDASIAGFLEPRDAPALTPWSNISSDGATWIRYPDVDGRRRYLRIGGKEADVAGVDGATWRWLDLRSGLATVTAATQDRFVPQMLNLEALGGVDFKKGCYPGQEIVARSQYLGKLKRRTALASFAAGTTPPAAATDVFEDGRAEPVGLVVDAACGPDGGGAALVELPLTSFDSTSLHAGTPDGPPLTLEPLPYPLPDNEVFVRPKL